MHYDGNYIRFMKAEYEKLAKARENESDCAGFGEILDCFVATECKAECICYTGEQLAYRLRLYNILLKAIANELNNYGEGVD